MRKYVLYIRVSSLIQKKSGLGLEAQERDIQLFLENYAETPYEVLEKFVEVQSSDDGVGEGGYAKETSDEYKKKQEELIHKHIAKSDAVITTALIPGKPAPILISQNMIDAMQPGSVIVDLAAENGGNCELTRKDEIVKYNDVIIDGTSNFPATMPTHASELYAKNILAFTKHMIKDGKINIDIEDEIISGALFTYKGEITDAKTQEAFNAKK